MSGEPSGQGPWVTSPPGPALRACSAMADPPVIPACLRGQETAAPSSLCHNQQGHKGNFGGHLFSFKSTSQNVQTSKTSFPQKQEPRNLITQMSFLPLSHSELQSVLKERGHVGHPGYSELITVCWGALWGFLFSQKHR